MVLVAIRGEKMLTGVQGEDGEDAGNVLKLQAACHNKEVPALNVSGGEVENCTGLEAVR